MLVLAFLTQGFGLVVALLVARYLGPAALGVYAVVMGVADLLEVIAPLGQRSWIIREVARDRSRMFAHWLNASLVTLASSLVLGAGLLLFSFLTGFEVIGLTAAVVVSLFVPVGGLRLVAQSTLQGMERMEHLPVSTFAGRVVGLLVMWLLLRSGTGVTAAFVGHGLYGLVAWLILLWAIHRQPGRMGGYRDSLPTPRQSWTSVRASLPFALQVLLDKGLLRVNLLILPLLLTMAAIGMYDAGDRVRQASAMLIPLVTISILPTLSRTFVTDRRRAARLVETALKILLILVLPFVFIVAIAADQIIPLLYGPGYEAAIPVLRIVIWSQIFLVADQVLNQVLVGSGNERGMVRRTAVALAVNLVLTLVMVWRFGVLGAAWATTLTRIIHLGLDAQLVAKQSLRLNLVQAVGKPLLCALLCGAVALALRGQPLVVLLAGPAAAYAIMLLVLGVISPDEWQLLRQLPGRMWHREAVRK